MWAGSIGVKRGALYDYAKNIPPLSVPCEELCVGATQSASSDGCDNGVCIGDTLLVCGIFWRGDSRVNLAFAQSDVLESAWSTRFSCREASLVCASKRKNLCNACAVPEPTCVRGPAGVRAFSAKL